MSGLLLYDKGYTDLVCVIPPDAELSPKSKVDPTMRGKCPGKKGKKGWFGYGFTKEPTPERDAVRKWERWGANIGMLGTRFPALDIDSDNPTLVRLVEQVADEVLGQAPTRTRSNSPRVLRVYGATEPFTRMAMKVEYKGSHLIEVLGHGRQYLVWGTHPSGAAYEWTYPLWELKPESLNEITPKSVLAFFRVLQRKLESKGIQCEIIGDGRAKEEKSPPQEELLAPSIEALADCVSKMSNTNEQFPDREAYLMVGYAIKAAAGEHDVDGFEIFAEWASRHEADDRVEGNPETWERDWNKMHGPYRVGWDWLVEQSSYCGGVDEFEADLTPPVEIPEEEAEPESEYSNRIEQDELWFVERVFQRIHSLLRYSPQSGQWHFWNRYQWKRDELLRHEDLIRFVMAQFGSEAKERAATAPNATQQNALLKLGKRWAMGTLFREVVRSLRSRSQLVVEINEFDTDPWLLNTPGFIVDLRTGKKRPSDPEALCAMATAVTPEPGDAPRWKQYLHETTGGDKELERFLQKLLGYCLTGLVKEQTLSFIWGGASTGKSLFIKTIMLILGDYAANAEMDTFTRTRQDRHPADLAKLVGKRLVTASETQGGRAWDEARIKRITAGDRIDARFMRENWFTYRPSFKLIVVGNFEPEIRNLDDAMRRRVHIVPFTYEVPRDQQIELYEEILVHEEGPQILFWMIQGCVLWQKEGLNPPEAVVAKTQEYHYTEDIIQQWIDERCELDGDLVSTRTELFSDWKQWARARGEEAGTLKTFKRKLDPKCRALMIADQLVGPRRLAGYRGIALSDEMEDDLL